jgi:hypothetical protein
LVQEALWLDRLAVAGGFANRGTFNVEPKLNFASPKTGSLYPREFADQGYSGDTAAHLRTFLLVGLT